MGTLSLLAILQICDHCEFDCISSVIEMGTLSLLAILQICDHCEFDCISSVIEGPLVYLKTENCCLKIFVEIRVGEKYVKICVMLFKN